jgi:hypothetical protein
MHVVHIIPVSEVPLSLPTAVVANPLTELTRTLRRLGSVTPQSGPAASRAGGRIMTVTGTLLPPHILSQTGLALGKQTSAAPCRTAP